MFGSNKILQKHMMLDLWKLTSNLCFMQSCEECDEASDAVWDRNVGYKKHGLRRPR